MKSLVVFADLRRPEPLVRQIDGSEFCVLLNADHDNVQLRSSWSPLKDAADFVLRVHRPTEQIWSIGLHPESPSANVKAFLVDLENPVIEKCKAWNPDSQLSCGEAFRVALGIDTLERAFQMTVLDGDSPNVVGTVEEHEDGKLKPKHLMELPHELLVRITSQLPWQTILYTLPLVSTKMFDVVKDVAEFPKLNLSCPPGFCRMDIEEYGLQVRNTCTVLQLGNVMCEAVPNQQEIELFKSTIMQLKWSVLKELHLVGQPINSNSSANYLLHALKKCNFPELEILVVLPSVQSVSYGWRHLLGAKLPKLKSLTLRVDEEAAPVYYSQRFEALEKLCLYGPRLHSCILPRVPENCAEGLFPRLKELKITVNPLGVNRETLGATFSSCRGSRIEQLSLMFPEHRKHLPEAWDQRGKMRMRAEAFFLLFPHLKSLVLDYGYQLDYTKSIFVDMCLGRLKVLKICVDVIDPEWCSQLVGLEEADIHFCIDNTYVLDHEREDLVGANRLAAILRLPKLQVLKVREEPPLLTMRRNFFTLDEAVLPVVKVLEIKVGCSQLDLHDVLRRVLKPFLNVRHVLFEKRRTSVSRDGSFKAKEAHSLVRLIAEAIPGIRSIVLRDASVELPLSKIEKHWPKLTPPWTKVCSRPTDLIFLAKGCEIVEEQSSYLIRFTTEAGLGSFHRLERMEVI